MKLGIGSYTYAWHFGAMAGSPRRMAAADLLEAAAALGANVVQLADNASPECLDDQACERLRRRADALGLDLEVGGRGLTAANLDRHVAIAQKLRARLLRFVIDAGAYQPDMAAVVALLRHAVPRLTAAGMVLAIENHDRFRAAEFAAMVAAVDAHCVGVCLDTVNSFGALEGPATVLETLAPYTVNLHLKDFTIRRVPSQMGFLIEGTPAGEGRLDIAGTVSALQAYGRCAAAIIESWVPAGADLEATLQMEADWAARGMATLRARGLFDSSRPVRAGACMG